MLFRVAALLVYLFTNNQATVVLSFSVDTATTRKATTVGSGRNPSSSIILSSSSRPGGISEWEDSSSSTRRAFLSTGAATAATALVILGGRSEPAEAIGPVKIPIVPTSYTAAPCPPNRPIPGQMAMRGMRGLCVTVEAELKEMSPKDLVDVGVYGFVSDGETGDGVLANNPDMSTDAGQFAMVNVVTTKDKKVVFEFVAAVPPEKDVSRFSNGIGPLTFTNLKLISFPGGQQFGAINPCEMNEFSDECEAWENENGPYERGAYMIKPNDRTKGR